MKNLLKRAGVATGAFFLIKGLAWLAIIAAATVWAGNEKARLEHAPRKAAVAARPGVEGTGASGGISESLPMGLGSAIRTAARACGQ